MGNMFISGLLLVTSGHLRQQPVNSSDEGGRQLNRTHVWLSADEGGRQAQLNSTQGWLSGLQHPAPINEDSNISTTPASVTDPSQLSLGDKRKIRSYVLYGMRIHHEGIGRMVYQHKAMTDFALSRGLGVVCRPEDWATKDHATGNLGFLFGCINESKVEGQFFSLEQLRGDPSLRWENVNFTLRPNAETHRYECSIDAPIHDHRVYNLTHVCRRDDPLWGQSWRFYRSQYHLVRTKDPNRIQALSGFNIVVLVRRGDCRACGFPPQTYVEIIELFQHITVTTRKDIQISVLAEESADSKDAKRLMGNFTGLQQKYGNILNTSFYFGRPEGDQQNATDRLIRDLDIISLADVLVLSPGTFSILGAALQMNGRAFSIRNNGASTDLPNVQPKYSAYSWANGSGYVSWPVPIFGSAELEPFSLP